MKTIEAVLVTPASNGKKAELVTIDTLDEFQELVGGWIEPVTLNYKGEVVTMWVDEEYLYKYEQTPEQVNWMAADIANLGGDPRFLFAQPIFGNAVFTGGTDREGNTLSVGEAGKRMINRVTREAIGATV